MLRKIETIKDLAWYLNVSKKQLKNVKPDEHYSVFEIKKPGTNKTRLIEAPTGWLKFALDRLSDGLQWIYSDYRTSAAHGFIRSVKNDPDKRSIFTNAKKHIGKKYLLNMDFNSFFHQVTEEKVWNVFSNGQLFSFNTEVEELLTKLVCFNGRLPMGSPTSPPLSNFAVMDLDKELTRWCFHQQIVYTRFVDDLSFSSNKQISDAQFGMINTILNEHHFSPNNSKTKWYGQNDEKEVTGLIVSDDIELPKNYLDHIKEEIERLKMLKSLVMQYPDFQVIEWSSKLEKAIQGKINFVKSVYGNDEPEYRTLLNKFYGLNDNIEEMSMSWKYAGYEFYC